MNDSDLDRFTAATLAADAAKFVSPPDARANKEAVRLKLAGAQEWIKASDASLRAGDPETAARFRNRARLLHAEVEGAMEAVTECLT